MLNDYLMNSPQKNWKLEGVKKLLRKIRSTGSIERQPGSGRKRSTRTDDNVEKVEELVLSQENKPQSHRSVRQISRETGIHRSSVSRIIHDDLNLKCFKRRRAQLLTEANRMARWTRCKELLKRYPESVVAHIWFSDEKIFTVEPPCNSQNDRLYASSETKKKTSQKVVCCALDQHLASPSWCRWPYQQWVQPSSSLWSLA